MRCVRAESTGTVRKAVVGPSVVTLLPGELQHICAESSERSRTDSGVLYAPRRPRDKANGYDLTLHFLSLNVDLYNRTRRSRTQQLCTLTGAVCVSLTHAARRQKYARELNEIQSIRSLGLAACIVVYSTKYEPPGTRAANQQYRCTATQILWPTATPDRPTCND